MARLNQINCEFVQPFMVDHVNGTSGPHRDRIQRHLEGCDACREQVSFLQSLKAAVSAHQPGPSLAFQKRLERAVVEAETGTEPQRLRRRVIVRVVAGVSAGVALFGSLLPSGEEMLALASAVTWQGAALGLAAAGLILLISSPLLFTSRRRLEESS
jgi:predicted anti-sigma-YlaC factor YlaD